MQTLRLGKQKCQSRRPRISKLMAMSNMLVLDFILKPVGVKWSFLTGISIAHQDLRGSINK